MQKLIKSGADVLKSNERGLKPRQITALRQEQGIVRLIDARKSFFVPLRSATQIERQFVNATQKKR